MYPFSKWEARSEISFAMKCHQLSIGGIPLVMVMGPHINVEWKVDDWVKFPYLPTN